MSQLQLSTEEISLCQRAIGEMAQLSISADGQFGPLSAKALKVLQKSLGLPETGVIDEASYEALKAFIDVRYVRTNDIVQAALSAGILPSMLLAISAKESTGAGFLPNGQCTILFERTKFYEFVRARIGFNQAQRWKTEYPDLCHTVWDKRFYKGGRGEWERLERARMLDATCSLLACSWGRWQVMGFNFNVCGYSDVQTFVADMSYSEHKQLQAVVNFITNQGQLYSAVRARNFETVARIYNGTGYKKNNYDTDLQKLESSFRKFN